MKKSILHTFLLFYIFLSVSIHVTGMPYYLAFTSNESIIENDTFRVMCYNIHHCDPPYNTGTDTEIDTIIGVISKQNPDIVALQEVDVYTTRSGSKVHQAKVIAESLGMNYFFAPAINYQGGHYGVAILSKFPISENTLIELPRPDATGEKRVLETAKITLPSGKAIRFGCTHLDLKVDNKRAQMDKINEIALAESLPFIVAGDFNAYEGYPVINTLDNVFKRTCYNCPPTSPARNPKNTIDYIAYRDTENVLAVLNHKVVNETYASDHRPVVADFEYIGESTNLQTPQSFSFTLLGRKIVLEQPGDIRIYNPMGIVLFQQQNTASFEVPESVGKGIFLISTELGSQKIILE